MSLKKEFVRDGSRRIIGSITTGYTGSFETIVRDEQNTSWDGRARSFGTTRDEHGKLVSINTADAGLLIGRQEVVAESVAQPPPVVLTLEDI